MTAVSEDTKMEEKNPSISVIMPVYKVEDCVAASIECIISQTFTDWELFAVDDGSPDRSGEICDGYAAKDERIHVIHKENGGAARARNAALKEAKGDYIFFMDSDDLAPTDMLEKMYAAIKGADAPLLVAGFFIDTYYSDTEYMTQEIKVPSGIYDRQSFREYAYELFDRNMLYTPWNKMYSRKYLSENGIEFPDLDWGEDFPFNLSVIRDIDKVCVLGEAYYHYIRRRSESETAKYIPDMYEIRETEHDWMEEIYEYWGVNDEHSVEFVARRYIERLVGCIENVTNPSCTLSKTEAKLAIRDMINTDRCAWALAHAKPRSRMMKMMLRPVANQNVDACYREGNLISRVKTRNGKLFAKLKANR